MRVTTVQCDRCKQVVDDDMAVIEAKGTLKATLPAVDLCGACARALADWLRGSPAAEPSSCLEREPFHP